MWGVDAKVINTVKEAPLLVHTVAGSFLYLLCDDTLAGTSTH